MQLDKNSAYFEIADSEENTNYEYLKKEVN